MPAEIATAAVPKARAALHFRRVRQVARRIALVAAWFSLSTGLAGLAGPLIARWVSGGAAQAYGAMPVALAAGFLAGGLSLLLAAKESFRPPVQPRLGRSTRWQPLSLVLAAGCGLGGIGFLLPALSPEAGRMVHPLGATVIAVDLVGFSAALVGWRLRSGSRFLQFALGLIGAGAWLQLVAMAYGVVPGSGAGEISAPFALAPMAALLLSAGVLVLRPFDGWMRLAVATHLAGRRIRRLLPVALLLPFMVAPLQWAIERSTPLQPGTVLAGITFLLVVGLVWLSLANALAIDRMDRQRRRLELKADHNRQRAEVALARAQAYFEGAPVSMLVIGDDGTIESLNGQAERAFGWPHGALSGQSFLSLAASGHEMLWKAFGESAARSTDLLHDAAPVELVGRRKDGSQFTVEAGFRVSVGGKHRLVVVHLRDISSRKRAEARLLQREQRLLEAQRLGRLGYWDWDAATDRVSWSEGLCHIMGVPPDSPAPRLMEQLQDYPSDSRAFLEHALKRALDQGMPYRLELTLFRRDGTTREVLAVGEARYGREGEVTGLFGSLQDISESKATRRALETASDRLRLATEAAQIGVWDWDVMHDQLAWDDRMFEIFGQSRATFGGGSRDWRQTVHPEDVQRVQGELRAAFAGGGGFHSEFRIHWPDGSLHHVRGDAVVQRDSAGRPVRMLGTYLDVTEAREAEDRLRESEQALRESEERFRLGFESAGVGMALVAPDGQWIKVNRTLCSMLGYEESELTGLRSQKLTHPDDLTSEDSLVSSVLAGDLKSYQRTKRYLNREGRSIWTHVTVALVRDSANRPLYFVSLIEDITQRRETENRVKSLHDQLRGILQFSPALVILVDRDGRYLLVSRSVELLLQKPAPEIVGRTLEEVLDPAAATTFRERIDRLAQTQHSFDVEDVRQMADGEHTYLATLFPLFDGEGRHVASGGIATDITEQRRAQQVSESALHEKDILLQEIHHRVKNNLQIISSLLQLESRSITDPLARERFEDCRNRVQAMALIHERLYRTGDLSFIDLGTYLESLAGQIIRSHGKVPQQMLQGVTVDVGPVDIELAVPCGLIVAELVTNALKHAFPGQHRGELRISLLARDGRWELAVADNGVGLAGKPEPGRGGSLGLKLVEALARQLHGSIDVDTQDGTTIKVSFAAPIGRKESK